jgi:hypothetical protein
MGPDIPSSRDFIESVDWVIPSDQRGFSSQTAEPYYATTDWAIGSQHSNVPIDYHAAEDGTDPFIAQVQTAMKSNPISFPYAGPIDGKKTGKWYTHLRNVLIQFGWALKKKFPNKTIPTIVSGGNINHSGFASAMAMLNMKPEEKDSEEETTDEEIKSGSDVIKSFQSFFASGHPLLGKSYSGEMDGEMSPELISAAKSAESVIAKAIKNKAAHGALVNAGAKGFNTSVSDLKSALNLIQKHQGKQNTAHLSAKDRILALSAIINE